MKMIETIHFQIAYLDLVRKIMKESVSITESNTF